MASAPDGGLFTEGSVGGPFLPEKIENSGKKRHSVWIYVLFRMKILTK